MTLKSWLEFLNIVKRWQEWRMTKRLIQAGVDAEKAKSAAENDQLQLEGLRAKDSVDETEEAILNDPNRRK